MKVIGAHHTSYTVSNLERSLAFYAGLLGCEVLWQREIADQYFRDIVAFPDCVVVAAHLKIPGSGHVIELFEYLAPSGTVADVRTNNVGSSHISFLVSDIHEAYRELCAAGVAFRSPPAEITVGANRGNWGVYVLDPDDITMELMQIGSG